MSLRSLLWKGPALAGALCSPASRPLSPAFGRTPTFQELQPAAAAGSRFLSQGAGESAGRRAVLSEEMLRKEADRVHEEFLENMKLIGQQMDEFWRLEVEYWAKFHKKLDKVEKLCNVTIFLSVTTVILTVLNSDL